MCPDRIVQSLTAWTNDALATAINDKSAAIDGREALGELLRRDAPQLAAVAQQTVEDTTATSELRSSAAVALGCCLDPDSQVALVRTLSSEDKLLVQHVATSLGKIGDESALAPLREADGGTSLAARRSIAFARSLIAYRLGLPGERLARPASSTILTLDRAEATPLGLLDVPAEAFTESASDLARELPTLPIAAYGSVRLSCKGEQLWVVLPEEIAKDGGRPVTKRNSVAAVVLKQSTCPEHWYVHEYVLTNPADDDSIEAHGVRPSGRTVHYGRIVVDDSADVELTLRAVDVAGIPALELTVGYSSITGTLSVREALSSYKARDTERDRLIVRRVRTILKQE